MFNTIDKQQLIAYPAKFGVRNLGKNPTARITAYEKYGLFPQAVTLGRPARRSGFYAPMHIELLKTILKLKPEMTYIGIRRTIKENFRQLFTLHDTITIFRLHYLDRELLEYFLARTGLTKIQSHEIFLLFEKKAAQKEIKATILNMMCELTPTTGVI